MFDQGANALVSGTLRGQPYKLFAVHAGVQNVPLLAFLAVSVGMRMGRFVFTVALAGAVARAFPASSMRLLFRLHAFVWLGFYLIYFLALR